MAYPEDVRSNLFAERAQTDLVLRSASIQNESGPCPSSHPKRLVTIFYGTLAALPHPPRVCELNPPVLEIWWSTDPFKDSWQDALNTSQPFVLSTGDPLGYGLHGYV